MPSPDGRYVYVLTSGNKRILLEKVKTGWKVHTPKTLKLKYTKKHKN